MPEGDMLYRQYYKPSLLLSMMLSSCCAWIASLGSGIENLTVNINA